jgi:hypothetical protein
MVAGEARSADSSNSSADVVPSLASGAMEILVESARIIIGGAGAPGRSDDEARIGAFQRVRGLADNPARAAPTVHRAILEVAEHARRLARRDT